MTTLRAAVFVTAERRGAAVLNGAQDANVLPRQPASVLLYELFACLPKNIGHLQRRPVHFLSRCLGRLTWSGFDTSSACSGLATACKWRRDR